MRKCKLNKEKSVISRVSVSFILSFFCIANFSMILFLHIFFISFTNLTALAPLRSADPKLNPSINRVRSKLLSENPSQLTKPQITITGPNGFSGRSVPNCNLIKLDKALHLKPKFKTTLSYFKNSDEVNFTKLKNTWENHWNCKCSESDDHNRFLYKVVGSNPLISTNLKNYILEEIAYVNAFCQPPSSHS